MQNDLARRCSGGHWALACSQLGDGFWHMWTSLMVIFITKCAAMNKIIQIQGIKCAFKLSTIICMGFIVLIMLFSCIFPTFYKNCYNFWTHNYFHMKFCTFMSNFLLYNARKSERKIFIFSRVIEISLGDYFFWATLYNRFWVIDRSCLSLPRSYKCD